VAEIYYAAESMCQECKRFVKHKPNGGPHKWHGCRLRWITRRIERARMEGWDEGYKFAVDNVSDPMVYADIAEYGTGWAGLVAKGGITIDGSDTGEVGDR
jgi:hypothetical protein